MTDARVSFGPQDTVVVRFAAGTVVAVPGATGDEAAATTCAGMVRVTRRSHESYVACVRRFAPDGSTDVSVGRPNQGLV